MTAPSPLVGPVTAAAADPVDVIPPGTTPAAQTRRSLRADPMGMAALAIMVGLVVVGLAAPLLAAYPSGYGSDLLAPPSAQHLFGTDHLGRDLLAQVIYGTRTSVWIATASSVIAIGIGTAVAVTGAYFRRLDGPIGMLVDLCLALPVLPLMILVAALAGPSLTTIVLVVAFFSWPEVARVVRSQALTVVTLPYMDAARLATTSPWWIITRHLLPAVLPVIIVSVVLTASRAVLSAAGLAFLGLGDPNSWSWGRILFESQQSGSMSSAWWTTLFPSLAIMALVVAATLLSIAYNDARDPRSRTT